MVLGFSTLIASAAVQNVQTTSKFKLLIIDDDPQVRTLFNRCLRAAGYDCAMVSSAAEGWEYLGIHPVDLVTLDIQMPGCTGLDLLDQIREKFPDTPVLMLTGESDANSAIRALTSGAFGYLVKPVDLDELQFQVRNGLERRRLVLENRQHLQQLEEKVREQTKSIRQAHEESIHRLVTASMYRDKETGAHIKRTGAYSELIAASAGWSRERVDQIRLAAPMHDIGKIGIPDAILGKPGPLTPEEIEVMRTHTTLGGQMLGGSTSQLLQMASEIALCHHERWDGAGYPNGLAGEAIPESARIVAIADVYDALSHDRRYRTRLSELDVLKLMQQGSGTQFDPSLIDIFMSLLPELWAIADSSPDEEKLGSSQYFSIPPASGLPLPPIGTMPTSGQPIAH
jgi:putative two-component system response regulator